MAFDTFYQSDEKTWSDQKTHLPTSQSQLENNFKEQSQRLVTFETFDWSDEETWPDQKRANYLPPYLTVYLQSAPPQKIKC